MSERTKSHFFLPVYSLLVREILRFLRERYRVVGAFGTPVLFWLILGSGFGESFRPPETGGEMDFLAYFFPGTVLLVVLFTTIFSSISIIEDRNNGFLQGVLVAPVPRLAIVLGKVLGGALLGTVQGLLLLLLAPLIGMEYGFFQFLAAGGIIFLTAVALTALGFLLAWRMDSVQGFHASMNLLLFPMWLMSGAFFPASGATGWVQALMWINPLSYGLGALRRVLYSPATSEKLGDASLTSSLSVLVGFMILMLLLASIAVRRPEPS